MTATSSTASSRSRGGAVARSETNGHFKTIKFKGLKLALPGTTKLRLLKQLREGTDEEMLTALQELLGEEQMEKVWDIDVDISGGLDALGEVLGDLAIAVFDAYGTSAGESGASSQRSKRTAGRSQPTSGTTTASE